jgi:hypothetical protein
MDDKFAKFFYFGCMDQVGHHVFSSPRAYELEDRRAVSDVLYRNPWGIAIDGGLCKSGAEQEGIALIHHKNGWTALAFWDRSVDKRGKSNSVFLAIGEFEFDQMVAMAKQFFPEVIARFPFEIKMVASGR